MSSSSSISLSDLARTEKALQVEETMSNLTSPSGENNFSSKRKRGLPGNPDPEAEVIALSPRSLLATNRFACEICGKGFQRDQNLQLHRRGHNLPWKLKQRSSKEVRKKVYVCPELTCVHHDPSRALGDLTGIKKHFCRKHGEKKWKCDKCNKKYAVHSDWKAHSKTCGTREYRCDCGTIFSRRDSFITHRAFCDALAEETTTTTGGGGGIFLPPLPTYMAFQNVDFPGAFSPPSTHMSATALLQKAAQVGASTSRSGGSHMVGLLPPPPPPPPPPPTSLLQEMVMGGFDGSFGESGGIGGVFATVPGEAEDGLTRDFLGLRHDFLGIAELSSCIGSSAYDHPIAGKQPWNGA